MDSVEVLLATGGSGGSPVRGTETCRWPLACDDAELEDPPNRLENIAKQLPLNDDASKKSSQDSTSPLTDQCHCP